MNSQLFLSVITPTLNRADMISDAIESVLVQKYPDMEHIIVDGASTDNTLAVLAKYPHLKVISGPDRGMYDAINHGIDLSQGKIVGFLNADDLYAEEVFYSLEKIFKDEAIQAVAGKAVVFGELGDGEQVILGGSPKNQTNLMQLCTLDSPFFNAWFFRKSIFEKIGKFNIDYRIVADREFMLRFALSGLEYASINKLVYQYRQHAGSMTFEITDQKLERIVNEHIMMTDFYLRKRNLPRSAKGLIRQLRTQDTVEMSFRCATSKQFIKSASYVYEGLKYDWRWPLQFWYRLLLALGSKIRN